MATYSFGQKQDGSLGVTGQNGQSTNDGVYAFEDGGANKMAELSATQMEASAPEVSPDFLKPQ